MKKSIIVKAAAGLIAAPVGMYFTANAAQNKMKKNLGSSEKLTKGNYVISALVSAALSAGGVYVAEKIGSGTIENSHTTTIAEYVKPIGETTTDETEFSAHNTIYTYHNWEAPTLSRELSWAIAFVNPGAAIWANAQYTEPMSMLGEMETLSRYMGGTCTFPNSFDQEGVKSRSNDTAKITYDGKTSTIQLPSYIGACGNFAKDEIKKRSLERRTGDLVSQGNTLEMAIDNCPTGVTAGTGGMSREDRWVRLLLDTDEEMNITYDFPAVGNYPDTELIGVGTNGRFNVEVYHNNTIKAIDGTGTCEPYEVPK